MTFNATTTSGKSITLIKPYNLKICKTLDTPSDSLYAEFTILNSVEELVKISVLDNEEFIFDGEVDEQRITCNAEGLSLILSARTNSKLIDNEAYPTTYTRPSLEDIYRIHLKPYGIKGVLGTGICQGDFAVSKGTCHWAVVDEFCRCVLNVCPQITSDGYLDAENMFLGQNTLKFCNDNNGCKFYEAQIKYKRYGVVGKINYKSEKSEDYKNVLFNTESQGRMITTERYLNLLDSQKWKRQYRLHREELKSLSDSFEIEIVTPFESNVMVGQNVGFFDNKLGNFNNLCVYEICYEISNTYKKCKITLVPRSHVV